MQPILPVLFGLVVGHFVMDFPLQGTAVALQKSPLPGARDEALARAVPWPYWLTAHALMHGGTVMVVTGSPVLGLLETAVHWATDLAKCLRKIDVHTDQAIHVACKIAWCLVWRYG